MSASDLLEFDWEDIRREYLAAVAKQVDYFSTEKEQRGVMRRMVERILAIHDRATQRIARAHIEKYLRNSLDRKYARMHTPRVQSDNVNQ